MRAFADAAWPVVILIAQNLVIFQNHYFRGYVFPWDFSQEYYAFTAFWTTVVGRGVFPSWVPFYAAGMPFDLLLQSGYHYPPLYLFPLLKISYSLHAAVVIQCLHVLFGAVGMYLFLRLAIQTERRASLYALLGAFAFQFFGGFYSNSEHVDIVRAFSFAPWLFFLFTVSAERAAGTSLRFLLIPPLILLLATGAYPGNLISSIAVINLYLLLQLIAQWARGARPANALRLGAFVLSLEVLGFALSMFHLGPGWFFRGYLQRATDFQTLTRFSPGIEHLPALFLDNALVPGEISMTSTFVALPTLILVTFLPLDVLRKHWPMAAVSLFSLLMAAGDNTFVGAQLPRFIPVLRYSRNPSSDYRVFFAIGLILFAALSARALVEAGIGWKRFLLRTGIVLLWFTPAVYVSYPILASSPVYEVIAVCIATIACLAIPAFYRGPLKLRGTPVMAMLLVLLALDAARVLPNMRSWQEQSSRRLRLYDLDVNTFETRPARIEKLSVADYGWEGFITGRFTLNNAVLPKMLASALLVQQDPTYKEYMLAAWSPLFFEGHPQTDVNRNNIVMSPESIGAAWRSAAGVPWAQVRQTRYGLNEIAYEAALDSPGLMIENEMYFPGWTASLTSAQGTTRIRAVSVNGLFRAWLLPAGHYSMLARFEFPYARVFAWVSVIALATWIFLLFGHTRRSLELEGNNLQAASPNP